MKQLKKAQRLREQGLAAARAGDRAKARALLSEALELGPLDAQTLFTLAELYDDEPSRRACLRYANAALASPGGLAGAQVSEPQESLREWLRHIFSMAVLPIVITAILGTLFVIACTLSIP